jgi:hypothetical protein
VRTERLPSPPARVVGDPEIIARHDSRHTGRVPRSGFSPRCVCAPGG